MRDFGKVLLFAAAVLLLGWGFCALVKTPWHQQATSKQQPAASSKQATAQQQTPADVLFEKAQLDANDQKQQALLDRIKRMPSTVDLIVVRLHNEALDGTQPIKLTLTAKTTLELKGYTVEDQSGSKNLSWSSADKLDTVIVTVRGKFASGLIYHGGKVYSVEPLGNGLHAMVQIDQSKFPKD